MLLRAIGTDGMWKWTKPYIALLWVVLIPLLASCSASRVEIDETLNPPSSWRFKEAKDDSNCINITGEYQMWGEPAPRWPSRFGGAPLSLDSLLGCYLDWEDKLKVDNVRVDHRNGNEITLSFFIGNGSVLLKEIPIVGRRTVCRRDRVIFSESTNTQGEAGARGGADIVHTIFLEEDSSLIVNTTINGKAGGLIPFRYREEYWVKFKPRQK